MTTDAVEDLLPPRADTPVSWERSQGARRRVEGILRDLPPGFVLLRDLRLPQPSRAAVEHLVVGPRNVWAVTTYAVDEPITVGAGRNDDTLFAGRRPLRPELEAADWAAEALSAAIGRAVEPIVVFASPSIPEPSFDFHGIRVCDPAALSRVVTTATTSFVDVQDVLATVERAFGVRPAASGVMPTLGSAVLPPNLRPAERRPRRWMPRRRHRLRGRHRGGVRLAAMAAVAALAVAAVPALRSAWGAVVDEGTDLVGGIDPTDDAAGAPAAPTSVRATLACPLPGDGWKIVFQWPGPVPEGALGYGVRTEAGRAAPIAHTVAPWSDPTDPPPPVTVTWAGPTIVHTDVLDADGTTVATATRTLPAPTSDC